ncbi:MAG TPA: response regulator [Planctomycetota bacterium]|jgi:DNA-binding response OmpR family regulator|nr:response regulator [Planctomycetota bacterium]
MRALVVSNAAAARHSMREILTKVSFQVSEASDVRGAMEVLGEVWPVDLALVDWALPGDGGLRFVRTVRSSREHATMRLIMMTSRLEMTEVFDAIRAGVDDYLAKPITRKRTLEKLAELRFYAV